MTDPSQPDSVPTAFVRDRERFLRLRELDPWGALTLIGATSADPRSIEELDAAWVRYAPDAPLEADSSPANDQEPSGPWMLLDMACQRIVAGGGEELPKSREAFQRDEGEWNPEIPVVWINFPPHWQRVSDALWEQALPLIPPMVEPLDFRGVLYGRALAADLAQRTLEIAGTEDLPATALTHDDVYMNEDTTDEEREMFARWHELTIRVHADWLMTPRDDLGGEPPRPFLHRGRDWVEHEMSNRQLQWSHQRRAPPGLARNSFAYRHGPPGRDEVVIYFDLCREVIAAAWSKIVSEPAIDQAALTEFLYGHARRWLKEGSIEGDPTPPGAMIVSERQRLPLTGGFGPIDDDCPICRMLADGGDAEFGPTFRGFDGHHLALDDEFAFSLCETREEWEDEQEKFRKMSEEFDAKYEADSEGKQPSEFDSAWATSFVADDAPVNAMALAFRLSELVSDLQSAGGQEDLIRQLNEAFESCRNTVYDPTLLQAAKSELVRALEEVAAEHSELTPKVADFQSLLDQWSREGDDMDIPF